MRRKRLTQNRRKPVQRSLEKLEKFLDENYTVNGRKIQTFFCGDTAGDPACEVYDEDGITVLWCGYYNYIEIFGLTSDEEDEIRKYGYNEH